MLIRDETPEDIDAIHDLTSTAFKPMPYSDGTEAEIVRRLRENGDLTISLVAEQDGEIWGMSRFRLSRSTARMTAGSVWGRYR